MTFVLDADHPGDGAVFVGASAEGHRDRVTIVISATAEMTQRDCLYTSLRLRGEWMDAELDFPRHGWLDTLTGCAPLGPEEHGDVMQSCHLC